MKYFFKFLTILLGIVVSALLAFHAGGSGSILSPKRASERKAMSTVERLIRVNLYSLDPICILFFCHSHSHSHIRSALCNVYPLALDSTRR